MLGGKQDRVLMKNHKNWDIDFKIKLMAGWVYL
jgi:hypothetical protein